MPRTRVSSLQFRVTVIVIGALILVICTTLSVFAMRTLQDEKRQIAELDLAIANAEKKIKEIDKLQQELETRRREFDIDTQILPDEAEIEAFIDSLYQSRIQPGIPPGTVTPVKSTTTAKNAAGLPLEKKAWSLKFLADFFQMAEFINTIENHQRFIRVDSFGVKAGQFDPQTAPSETIPNDVTMTISTFVYKSPAGEKDETK